MCIHCLGHFTPRPPTSTFSLQLPLTFTRQNLFCPYLWFCWTEDQSIIRKTMHFCSWVKCSYRERFLASIYKCVTTQVHSSLLDLYTGSWSSSHVDLCNFKISVLVPLEWRHQTPSVLGLLPIPIPPICALPLSCNPSPKILPYLP
jgi:hypothetical protein